MAMMRQSGTMTPVPMGLGLGSGSTPTPNKMSTLAEVRNQIFTSLQKNQYNQAFQAALCAADLDLLTQLCEQCQPQTVFETIASGAGKKPQCHLTQPVILSLIQQLSQDLSTNLDLKIRYLEEAVVSLDPNTSLTREHIPGVISQLNSKITNYFSMHPNDKHSRSLKMLALASQSLLQRTGSQKSGATAPTASASTSAISSNNNNSG